MRPGFVLVRRGGWFEPKLGKKGPVLSGTGAPINPAFKEWDYDLGRPLPLDYRCPDGMLYWINPKPELPSKVDETPLRSVESAPPE